MKIKIANKLILFFLLVAMVPLIIVGVVVYQQTSATIRNMIDNRLDAMADDREKRIEQLFKERGDDVRMLAGLPLVSTALEDLTRVLANDGINSSAYREIEIKCRPLFSAYTAGSGIHNIFLITPDGDIAFSIAKERDLGTNLVTGRYKDTELARVFNLAREGDSGVISDFRIYAPSNAPAAFIAAPVKNENGLIGVLAIQIPATEISALAEDYAGLGETGETIFVSRDGKDALFIAPTRHDPGAAFVRKIPMGSLSGIPAQESASGKDGCGMFEDYRGEKALASWRHIPSLGIGLILKYDEKEAIAPIRTLLRWFIYLGIITFLIVAGISLFLSRSISRPILALTRATQKMAGGDMTVRAEAGSGDEIGTLAASFNDMAVGLGKAGKKSFDQDWLKSGLARLNDVMRGDPDISKLSADVISEMATYLNAQIGVFYVAGDEEIPVLTLLGSYAFSKRKNLSNSFAPGEGLVGQAALEKQRILLKNVPEDYTRVTSALGESLPRFVCVCPIIHEDRVKGVVELATLYEMTDLQTEYLDQATPALALAVESARSRTRLADALAKSRTLTEELQAQQEELRAANEELEEQSQALRQSEERLQAQQEELRATNEELEEKNEALQRQKRDIEQANQELHATRAQIEERAEELAIAGKYKSEFLANMSHELRTPLNSLLLLAESLADNKEKNLSDEQRESARVIYESGNQLLSLINEVLDLARIEAGRMDLHMEKTTVKDLADGIRDGFAHMAAAKGLHFHVDIDNSAPGEIQTDKKRVGQIIRNLLSNAVKFTGHGEVGVRFFAPEKDTDLSRSGINPLEALAVSVRDTGIGVSKDKQKIIFEAFQQADGGTSRRYGGTGLGLSISRELAHLLGGEIRMESTIGVGSVFTLYLPIKGGAKTSTGEMRNKHREARTSQKSEIGTAPEPIVIKGDTKTVPDDRNVLKDGDRTILIIEDDARFAAVLMKKCHERGFKCITAASGEEGLEAATKFLPNAIILDIRLPGMDGWSVLEMVKENPSLRHIPVHIMSVEDPAIDAFRKGAIGFLKKPTRKAELETAFIRIEDIIDRKIKNLLVVEDNEVLRKNMVKLIGNGDVHTDEAGSGEEALLSLSSAKYDCVILDLGLPDMTGFDLLKKMEDMQDLIMPPIIVYTGRNLTQEEERELSHYADSIIIKGVKSDERLLDETALFLHRMVSELPEKKRKMIVDLHQQDQLLTGKKILLADDDMRNVFALSRALEEKGMTVIKAEDGKKAVEALEKNPDVDIVLMDIMMPVMDGHAAMREIRKSKSPIRNIPIIALTAKAMKGDREHAIEAGANDYLTKPVDLKRLLSMLRVWLYR